MIYLDKNYPPAEIKITIDAIKAHAANQSSRIRAVALVPQAPESILCGDFPFSTQFLT